MLPPGSPMNRRERHQLKYNFAGRDRFRTAKTYRAASHSTKQRSVLGEVVVRFDKRRGLSGRRSACCRLRARRITRARC